MRARRYLPLGAIIFLVVLAIGGYRVLFPHGHRVCRLPCLVSALRGYAADNDDRFPTGTNSYAALAQIYPRYLKYLPHLAGISGSEEATTKGILEGTGLSEGACSWVYHPGLALDDSPELALIWERNEGLSFNGRRRRGHAVGFVDGAIRQIPLREWSTFLEKQARLRSEAEKGRKRL